MWILFLCWNVHSVSLNVNISHIYAKVCLLFFLFEMVQYHHRTMCWTILEDDVYHVLPLSNPIMEYGGQCLNENLKFFCSLNLNHSTYLYTFCHYERIFDYVIFLILQQSSCTFVWQKSFGIVGQSNVSKQCVYLSCIVWMLIF